MAAALVVSIPAAWPGIVFANDEKKDKMGGMDMRCMADMNGIDMSSMGPSMAAMACHMYVTPSRPSQPGDAEKAKEVEGIMVRSMEEVMGHDVPVACKSVVADCWVKP